MGSVVQRQTAKGPVWYAVYWIAGKQRWKRVPNNYPGKRGARQFLAECEAQKELEAQGNATYADAARAWLLEQKTRVKPQTFRAYEQYNRVHVEPAFGRFRLNQIKPGMIQDFVTRKCEDGVSPAYVQNGLLTVLRAVLENAVRLEQLHRNPARVRFTYPRRIQKAEPVHFLTPAQIQTLLQHADEHWNPLFVVAIWTGLRMGELLAMRWQYLDGTERRYYVEENLQQNGEWTTPKNAASHAPVPLSPFVCQTLTDWREQVLAWQLQAARWADLDLVFPRKQDGKPRGARGAQLALQRALKAADLPYFRFHDLRHTCASLLINSGADAKTVQKQLRHSSVTITLDTYSHLWPERQDEAVELLDQAMGV